MNLEKLVSEIKKDFEVERFPEDWHWITDSDKNLQKKATSQFLKENRGLILKNSDKVEKIYVACFPSTYVLKEIAKQGQKDVLLLTHHPFDWNGVGMGFKNYSAEDYKIMKDNRISLMFMHVPWDRVRNEKDRVSTAYGTAKLLEMKVKGEFQEYYGAIVSVYGNLPVKTFDELVKYVGKKLGNKSLNVFSYGPNKVNLIAFVPGGGNSAPDLKEAYDLGADTYITGCTNRCKHPYSKAKSKEFIAKAKELRMNILGASHYLTEKWAMEQSVPFFKKRYNLPVKCIEDKSQYKNLD